MLSAAVLLGCKENKQVSVPDKTVHVEVGTVEKQQIPLVLGIIGRTQAVNTVAIRPRVDGHIVARSFVEGADVSKGDVLFTLDQRPYKAEIEKLEGDVKASEAALKFAKLELARFQPLEESGSVSPEKLEEKTSDLGQATGQLQASKGALRKARVDLEYTTLRAPIDGRTGKVLKDVGSVVSANETVMIELVQMDPLYVNIHPSEQQVLNVERHQKQNGKLPIKLFLVDGSEHPHEGTIDFISPKVDPTTGTITVRIVFPNPDKSLRPGQFAKVDVQLEDQPDVLTVPEEAVQQDQVGSFVYTVGEDNTATLKRVKAGRRYKGVRVIEEGLKAGEKVVTKGQERVHSGGKVQAKTVHSDGNGGASGG